MKKLLKIMLISTSSLAMVAGTAVTVVSCGTQIDNGGQNDTTSTFKDDVNAVVNDVKGQTITFLQGSIVQKSSDLIGNGDYGLGNILNESISNYSSIDHYTIASLSKALDTSKVVTTKKPLPLLKITFIGTNNEQYTKTINFFYTVEKNTPPAQDTFDQDVDSVAQDISNLGVEVAKDSTWDSDKVESLVRSTVAEYDSISSFSVTNEGTLDTNTPGTYNVSITIVFTDKNNLTKTSTKNITLSGVVVKDGSTPTTDTFADDVQAVVNKVKAQTFNVNKGDSVDAVKVKSLIQQYVGGYNSISSFTVNSVGAFNTSTVGNQTQTAVVQFTNANSTSKTKTLNQNIPIKINVKDSTPVGPITPTWDGKKTLFAPYTDPTMPTASFPDLVSVGGANSSVIAFYNQIGKTHDYGFGLGSSLGDNTLSATDVKNLYKNVPNFSPIMAIGGVAATGSGDNGGPVLPTYCAPINQTAGVCEDNETISNKIFQGLKDLGSHILDWDIEGQLPTKTDVIQNTPIVAKMIQDKAKSEGYALKQMLTHDSMGQDSEANDPSKLTKEDVMKGSEYAVASTTFQVIKGFYAQGVDILLNAMSMEYVWRTNYDVQPILNIGGIYNFFKKQLSTWTGSWTDEQIFAHIGITPMIGHQSNAPGIFSLTGAEYLAKWAKTLNIGLLAFWSTTRDHPLPTGVDWHNNPTSFGLTSKDMNGDKRYDEDWIYTRTINQYLNS